jgi:hypothetical protein
MIYEKSVLLMVSVSLYLLGELYPSSPCYGAQCDSRVKYGNVHMHGAISPFGKFPVD